MASLSELRKYTRIIIPILGTIALASCSSVESREPTVDEIKANIPKPQISPEKTVIYTRKPNTGFTVNWTNLYGEDSFPEVDISPEGTNFSWTHPDWFNPFTTKNKLKVEGLPEANEKYQITLSGENCTTYKGQLFCTDLLQKTVDVIYDTIPPTAQVTGFYSKDGKLYIQYQNFDNLAGPTESSSQTVIRSPKIGNNGVSVNVCDNAGNCQDQILLAAYDPFNRTINMEKARLEDNGRIVISGYLNDPSGNIDLEATDISARQTIHLGPMGIPEMAMDLNKIGLNCTDPQFSGYHFTTECVPTGSTGRAHFKITVTDKVGNKYSEQYEVEVPPLDRSKANLFYAFLTTSFLSSASLLTKIRGDRVQRERRANLITAVKSRELPKVVDAASKLVKRDKKKFPNMVDDYNFFRSIEEDFFGSDFITAIKKLGELNKRNNPFIKDLTSELVEKIIAKINGILGQEVGVKGFNEPRIVQLVDFLTNILFNSGGYDFFWQVLEKSSVLKTNVLTAVMIHLMQNKAIRGKEAAILRWSDVEKLRKSITKLAEKWKNYQLIIENLEFLANINDPTGKPGKISRSIFDEVKKVIDSHEEVSWRSLEQKLRRIIETKGEIEGKKSQLEEVKMQFAEVRLYKSHHEFIKAGIEYTERELNVRSIISQKGKEVTELALKHDIPPKGPLMKKFQENVMSALNGTDVISILVNRSQAEAEVFILAYIVLHLMPLGFFVGAEKIQVNEQVLMIDKIPAPDKHDLVDYHSEGPLANKYKQDPLLMKILLELYTRFTQDYNQSRKNHKTSNGKSLDYPEWIPLHDGAMYGKKEAEFIMELFKAMLINFTVGVPMHRSLCRWTIDKLGLVAK